jgi:hypothetical protein
MEAMHLFAPIVCRFTTAPSRTLPLLCLNDHASYKAAANHGAAKFLHDTMEEVWYNNLKDTDTF